MHVTCTLIISIARTCDSCITQLRGSPELHITGWNVLSALLRRFIDFAVLTSCRRPHSQCCNHTVLLRSHFDPCTVTDPHHQSFSVGLEDPAKAEPKTWTRAGTGGLRSRRASLRMSTGVGGVHKVSDACPSHHMMVCYSLCHHSD